MNGEMIYDMMVDCTMLLRTGETYPDGMGGYRDVYADGATFRAFIRQDVSKQDVTGQQQVLNEKFSVIVNPETTHLKYHELFRRNSDAQVFRLTGNTDDFTAPARATVPLAIAGCERWVLP